MVNDQIAFGLFKEYKFDSNGRLTDEAMHELKNSFGALDVPMGMRPVSDFRRQTRPLITMPFGPPQPWMERGHEGAASSAGFGSSLAGRKVNQSGYLSLWNAQPRSIAPSWNPLLMQGGNMYVQGDNSPTLGDVVTKFGRNKKSKLTKSTKKKTAKSTKKTVKKVSKKSTSKRN